MQNINATELFSAINSGDAIAVLYTRENCGPCNRVKPMFQNMAMNYSAHVSPMSIDIMELEPHFITGWGLRTAPTLILYVYGQERARLTGDDVSAVNLQKALDELVVALTPDGEGDYYECEACQ